MIAMLKALIMGSMVALNATVMGQINPASSTDFWTPIQYGPGGVHDYSTDQQTGSSEGDIVGNASNPALYIAAYNGGTPTLFTDGELAFRFRLGGDKSPAGYKGVAFIGMDLNSDGSLDLFAGVNNSGSSSIVGLWFAGAGGNTSPNTTGVASTPTFSYVQTSLNYSWTPVTAANNPGGTTDVDGGGTDYFLSFKINFADLVSMASTIVPGFNENSVVSFVGATATQPNSLNQDLNGVNGDINSTLSWGQLGAISSLYTADGELAPAVVPEPAAAAIVGFCLAALIILRRR